MKKTKTRRSPTRQTSQPPEILILRVEDLARAGHGVAKDPNGRVVFVPFSAPGDVVKVRITSRKSKYAQSQLLDVVEPSEQRQVPACPVFGRCGGCDWQHIAYSLQWRTKCDGVKQALVRAHLSVPQAWQEYPAQQTLAYRNRIQLHGNKGQMGFFAKGSHTIVPIEHCAIARRELNDVIASVREQAKSRRKPYKVELELLTDGTVRVAWDSEAKPAGDYGGFQEIGGFQQINAEQNGNLQQWVWDSLSKQRPILDLYGGSANLSARFADQSPRINCVDLVVPDNDDNQWPDNLVFHQSDVFAWVLVKAAQAGGRSAAETSAIIDPPRGGMPEQLPQFIEALQRLNVTELIAVGCKTDPWVRDIEGFVQRGWRLEKGAVFDFFPQTSHVESAALLKR